MAWFKKKFNKSSNKHGAGFSGSSEIEKKMKLEREREKKTIRILLLGPGDSGKTTILKQMKKIHNKHDEAEQEIMAQYIQDAVMQYMKLLCQQSVILHEQYDEKTLVANQNEELRKEILSMTVEDRLGENLGKKIQTLWMDKGIQTTLANRHHFQIHDNVAYFLNRIEEIATEDYQPSFEDYLRIRTRSTGFQQTKLVANIDRFGQHIFEFTDGIYSTYIL